MLIPGIISTFIFFGCLYLIFTERINRSIAAMIGATIMVILGLIFGFYTEDEAVLTLDVNTLGLLLGMMILVALLEPTGFFQFLAVWVARFSKGRPLRLLVLLGAVTTIISMFLNNVTTVVLIAPVTILICEILGISPRPFLMSEALLSNTGGLATLVGDPPNVLIASAANLSFLDFLTHTLPVVVVVWFLALALLSYMFHDDLKKVPENTEAIEQLSPAEVFGDRKSAYKILAVIVIAVVAFLLEEVLQVRPALIALSGAAIAMTWVQPNVQETLKRIDWDVLLFFAALFIMVGGMQQAGVMHALAGLIIQAKNLPPMVIGLGMLWAVALLSAIIDNVPITIALIPVVLDMASAGINPFPLWWALAIGAGLGGNGTIIGSTANVIVASLSERTHTPITSATWNKRGFPIMLATCAGASLLYILLFPLMSK
jgi:Na+/H+ antiporter NhaD/arsenite permease-like protein